MISLKVEKALKIESFKNVTDKTFSFAVDCTKYPFAREAEAKYLANVMTGQDSWQGIKPEIKHFSGLARLANKYLATTATTLRIKEQIVYGDGTSLYYIK